MRTPRQIAADTLRDLRIQHPGAKRMRPSFQRGWAASILMVHAYRYERSHLALARDCAGLFACAAMILRTEPGR